VTGLPSEAVGQQHSSPFFGQYFYTKGKWPWQQRRVVHVCVCDWWLVKAAARLRAHRTNKQPSSPHYTHSGSFRHPLRLDELKEAVNTNPVLFLNIKYRVDDR